VCVDDPEDTHDWTLFLCLQHKQKKTHSK